MEGGMNAWQGLTASGLPDEGMSFFPEQSGPAELIALAWILEDGTGKFYTSVAGILSDKEAIKLFTDLASAEEHHKSTLLGLYLTMTGMEPRQDFPHDVITADNDTVEGGVKLGAALLWVKGRDVRQALEFSMALETNAYDRYIKMKRRISGEQGQRIFDLLIKQEKEHLGRMAALLDEKFSP